MLKLVFGGGGWVHVCVWVWVGVWVWMCECGMCVCVCVVCVCMHASFAVAVSMSGVVHDCVCVSPCYQLCSVFKHKQFVVTHLLYYTPDVTKSRLYYPQCVLQRLTAPKQLV